ncbi:MAG: hypothetical protein WA609_07260 [Terriglobales bacterium]
MKRFLRLLVLIGATVYGLSFLLHICSYPKEDIPSEVWAGLIFLCCGLIYLYLVRKMRPTPPLDQFRKQSLR